ncbi:hypothetical protein [Pseudomonas purpurea]|uniref:hypothetical protein n=1 Tax=Pseudomonas purpurea TaxID=3136737 RepID=UPI003264E82F
MNPASKTLQWIDHCMRALSVFCLANAAKGLMVVSVRLYARGWLSAVEVRFALGFCSTLNTTSVRLLRPRKK